MMRDRKLRELCVAMALLAMSVVAAFAPDAYLPMLFRAFLLPGCMLFAVIAAVALWKRAWWVLQSALAGSVLMASQLMVPVVPMIMSIHPSDLRVFHMNVLQPNTSHQHAMAQALASDADVISVQEVSPEWAVALREGLGGRYPYAHIEPRTNCYGIALFSRIPFTDVRTITLHGTPLIEAVLAVDDKPVRVVAVHTSSPISYEHFRRRNDQLADLAAHLTLSDTATIVVGDLNTVPWDRAYQRFCMRAGLHSTTAVTQSTWPAIGPVALIPLDHLLLSPGITPSALRTVHIPGSDHKGLLADLNLSGH